MTLELYHEYVYFYQSKLIHGYNNTLMFLVILILLLLDDWTQNDLVKPFD